MSFITLFEIVGEDIILGIFTLLDCSIKLGCVTFTLLGYCVNGGLFDIMLGGLYIGLLTTFTLLVLIFVFTSFDFPILMGCGINAGCVIDICLFTFTFTFTFA